MFTKENAMSLAGQLELQIASKINNLSKGTAPTNEDMDEVLGAMKMASAELQKGFGFQIQVLHKPVITFGSNDAAYSAARAKRALAGSSLDLEANAADSVKPKKKVNKKAGYGKVTQYLDVEGAKTGPGTTVSVWAALVGPSKLKWLKENGLRMTNSWKTSFKAFVQDVGYRPHPEAKLARIDKNKGFFPGNVEWRHKGQPMTGLKREAK